AIVGTIQAQPYQTNADDTIKLPYTLRVAGIGASGSMVLRRSSAAVPECVKTSDCGAGDVCPFEADPQAVKICVPAVVWNRPAAFTVGNQLDDARSQQWWTALSGLVGTTDATQAFGVANGSSKIETLMCTTSSTAAGAGHLGGNQVQQGAGPSLSGDLACVN